jgi:anti-sigma regulatory factor (Ser/Thr protein kinase)
VARVKVEITKFLEKVCDVHNGMTVGRDSENDIQLLAPTVSRSHAQFLIEGDNVILIDLGSSNGTRVNGKRIVKEILNDGDIIELGPTRVAFEKEVSQIADHNIFVIDTPGVPEDKIAQIVDRSEMGLVFPTETQVIDLAYSIGRKFLERAGFSENDNTNLLTALYEAIDNARRHGNKGNRSKRIHLYFTDSAQKVAVAVLDEGRGFDFATVLQESREQDLLMAARERYLAGKMGGLGIRLMLKCVDKIEYEMGGSKIVLTKYKQPLAKEEARHKRLTGDEEVYKRTLWEEIKLLEPKEGQETAREQPLTAQEERKPSTLPQADDRPLQRLHRFQNCLSSFFTEDELRLESEIETEREGEDLLEGLR